MGKRATSNCAICRNRGKERLGDLVVADLRDGQWHAETLEAEKTVASAIVTASWKAVYCFYVPKAGESLYEVRYRRFADGAWGESVKIAEETQRINHLAAPQISPPDYAAILWDQHFVKRTDPSEVKSCRVPDP